jgi:hypothetical protein
VSGVFGLGAVGLDWQVAGFGPMSRSGASDMVLRNTNTGAFQVYNIANNRITMSAYMGFNTMSPFSGQIGLDWQVGGFAADAPSGSTAAMGESSLPTQLVQAMAGFGGGSSAADGLNTISLAAETLQQPLVTTPQHA